MDTLVALLFLALCWAYVEFATRYERGDFVESCDPEWYGSPENSEETHA